MFDFPMSDTWKRAYGLSEDDRPQEFAPTPDIKIALVREVCNLETLHTDAQFRMLSGDIEDPKHREIARGIAFKRLQYMHIMDGNEISLIRVYRKRNDTPGYFWVEYSGKVER